MDTVLSVRALTHRYDPEGPPALDGVSFELGRGVTVLVGPNGAGKTTLLRIVTGVLYPTEGEVVVAGSPVPSPAASTAIGYLPEGAPSDADATVEEYLGFWAALRGVAPGRVRDALERFRLTDRADRPIGTLSKGYRQRVGLAAAVLHDPALVVLDEPTSALDPNQVREARATIRGLGDRRAVLLSTHILAEAEAIADRILLLHRGRLVGDGTAASLRAAADRTAASGVATLEDAFAVLTEGKTE